MDWIDEYIETLRNRIKNSSIYMGLLCTLILGVIVAFIVYIFTQNICTSWSRVLIARYMPNYESEMDMEVLRISNMMPFRHYLLCCILWFLRDHSLILYLVVFEYIGLRNFVKKKLQIGYEAANTALGYIMIGDYGHEQNYFDQDEMGKLCNQIEQYRKDLVVKSRREWSAQSEQASINAAFAHDIRTPLTVMKGYTEFLLKYVPKGKISQEALLEKLSILLEQQERLLKFSNTMKTIQTLDMRTLNCVKMPFQKLIQSMVQTLTEIEAQTGIAICMEVERQEELKDFLLIVDVDLIHEVYENLISNALRYANEVVKVRVEVNKDQLMIYVEDDGEGFSIRALKEAKNLYWSEEKGTSSHFGMGLYICERLCEKHGGKMNIVNGVDGGAIVACEFKIQ